MRTIKFRAWDYEMKEMIDSVSLSSRIYEAIYGWDKDDSKTSLEVMQFTSLLDKNGKEIYEGDILLFEDSVKVPITDEGNGPYEDVNYLCPIVFEEGCFGIIIPENGGVFHKGFHSWTELDMEGYIPKEMEVIGNIYENKDLLK